MSEKKYILEVDELGINFGGLRAVNNFSMKIEEGAALRSNWPKWCW